jgi:hypothetical protein
MVSCRVLTESPESTRLEWRVPGADVDPYLAISALLASAREGIESDTEPGEPLMGSDFERPVAPLRRGLRGATTRLLTIGAGRFPDERASPAGFGTGRLRDRGGRRRGFRPELLLALHNLRCSGTR